MGPPDDMVLFVVKTLYSMPESGLHWYTTFLEYYIERLGMVRTTADPCVMVAGEGEYIFGPVALQVDDSLSEADEEFMRREEVADTTFRSELRTTFGDKAMAFIGVRICLDGNGGIMMQQQDILSAFTLPRDEKDFPSKRTMTQFIG